MKIDPEISGRRRTKSVSCVVRTNIPRANKNVIGLPGDSSQIR